LAARPDGEGRGPDIAGFDLAHRLRRRHAGARRDTSPPLRG
jgi:hypothetical protein